MAVTAFSSSFCERGSSGWLDGTAATAKMLAHITIAVTIAIIFSARLIPHLLCNLDCL
jgi:hypothetical protein